MPAKILFPILLALCLALTACAPASTVVPSAAATDLPPTATPLPPSDTPAPSATPTPAFTPTSTATETPSPIPTVESLKAVVNTNLLSCRYGPGPEYLYLDAFRQGLHLTLVGQTGGNNWVWVKGDKNNCWVNAKFLDIEGDFKTLPIVYPEPAHIPITSRYPSTTVLSATRDGDKVTVVWLGIPVSAGDYEDENMFIYIIETWRCEGGQI
ncbi:MAG TPA: hypothetical protein PKC99_14715, partial [Anaerolineales bacterium]|nr:hypothetical protein [Anaerolineales bacterium]